MYSNNTIKPNKDYQAINSCYTVENMDKGIDNLDKCKGFKILWNKIYKTQIIKEYNIKFDVKLDKGEDYKFNVDYFRYISKFKIINNKLYNYYISENGLTQKYDKNEFERRISNLNYQRDFYRQRNYSLEYLNIFYIIASYAAISKRSCRKEGITRKEQRDFVKKIITNVDVCSSLKQKNEGNFAIKLLGKILKYKMLNTILIISYVIKLKKVSYGKKTKE